MCGEGGTSCEGGSTGGEEMGGRRMGEFRNALAEVGRCGVAGVDTLGDGGSAPSSACSWRNEAFERSESEEEESRCGDKPTIMWTSVS